MANPDAAVAACAADGHGQGLAAVVVEVIHCPGPSIADRETLSLPAGATVADALRASSVPARHPGLDPFVEAGSGVGIHGRLVVPGTRLNDGDRVELYRPLQVDPKEARRVRQRAQKAARPSGRGTTTR